jgi:lysophospholipase L1-like esterase
MWSFLFGIYLFFVVCVIAVDVLYFNPRDLRLSPYEYDETMGWLPKRDFSRNIPQRDAAGNKYNAFLSYDHHRFRAYGDPATRKTKILFLGDSFTGDPFTGNQEMYFSVVKSVLREKYNKDVEIFAVGGGGYGTLQEYLLIKEQIKIINPDFFVLQFSDNDFINNLLDWENNWIVRNQRFYRPYYSINTGKILYSPSPYAGCYKFANNNSYFFRRLDIIFQQLQYKYYGDYTNRKFTSEEIKKFQADSYNVTIKLLAFLKNEFSKDAKLFVMVDLTEDNGTNDLQIDLAKESGYIPLLFPLQNLHKYEAEHNSATLRHADGGHLNILGNKILGEGLAADLFKHMNRQN